MIPASVLILAMALGCFPTSPSPQSTLEDAALRFARAWFQGGGGGLERLMKAGGIRLHLPGEEHRSVPPRQARAALDDFLKRHPGSEPRVIRATTSEGDPRRGLAELRLEPRAVEGGEAVIFSLFVGFSLEPDGWVVTEVRILP